MPDGQLQTEAIIEVIRTLEEATNAHDFDVVKRTLALDDNRFCEIEFNIPLPFGSEMTEDIINWLSNNPGYKFRLSHSEIQVFNLSPTVAYAVALNEWRSIEGSGVGRVTFILVKDERRGWRILHIHSSAEPPEEA